MINKVVIPAAGLGTRLLPLTKEMPKEMLPIFVKKKNRPILLKPMLQVIFEKLYDFGFNEFCFIVGRGKRAIEDHFTSDFNFIQFLRLKNKDAQAEDLEEFYRKLNDSNIVFINQPEPKGFGDAIFKARSFTGDDTFMVHAGDDLIASTNSDYLSRLLKVHKDYDSDSTFLVEEIEDPRRYGVIIGEELEEGVFEVKKIIEKPSKPPTNLATIAIYIFKSIIYDAIKNTPPDKDNEVQLTSAIHKLIIQNYKIHAVKLRDNEERVDIGIPEAYQRILRLEPKRFWRIYLSNLVVDPNGEKIEGT